MAWQTTCPDGTQSVANNNTIIQQNTTYTKTTMNVDHFWNIGTDEDGHHKYVQTVATNDDVPSVITDPTLATGMDLVYYSRFKTATEATAAGAQTCQPFALNNTSIMQLLGIQACAVFNVDQSTPFAVTIVYKYNVSTVVRENSTTPATSSATGNYTINFTNNLPSNGYLVLGGGIRYNSTNGGLFVGVQSNTTVNSVKSLSSCKIITVRNESASLVDPLQVWVVMFGG